MASLKGRVALITGASRGIGRALALGLANAGADVAPSSRRQEQVDATAAEIEAAGKMSLRVASDVGDRKSLEELLKAAIAKFGKVDILINCAGTTKRAPTLDFSEEVWNQIIEVNLTGTLRGCQVFGKHMLERGRCRQGRSWRLLHGRSQMLDDAIVQPRWERSLNRSVGSCA